MRGSGAIPGTGGQATVSALEKVESSSDAGETWRPIFSLSAGGKEYSIRSSSSSNPPAYRIGEQVEMLYPSENPAEGTVLIGKKDGATYTVGSVTNADGGVTKTILTTYEGKYLALSGAIRNISDHIMGIVAYFDADANE